MIRKRVKRMIALTMGITLSGGVVPVLTSPAITVFAEENTKTKEEDNDQEKNRTNEKDNSNNEENGDNIKLLNNVSNVSQSTTGQSVNLLNVNEGLDDSDNNDIDLYTNGDDLSWITTDKFNGEGSTVTINNIEFKLKKNNTVELSEGNSYDQEELILLEKIIADSNEYEVISVGNYAWQFEHIKNVSLPKVTSIGEGAFYGCNRLESISLPELTSVAIRSFNDCRSLKNVNVPKTVSVCEDAFYGCSNLKNVNMPKAESIEDYAFYNCTSLESIIIPKVKSIVDNSFMGSDNIQNAVVSSDLNVDDIKKIPAKSIIKVKDNGNDYTITDIEKKSEDWKIILPSKIGEKPVTDISDEAIEVIKNNADKVQVDSRSILNILKNKNVDISKMDITIIPANKTELEEYYKQNNADKYNKNNYPVDIYKVYENSLRKTEEVLNDKYVSQEDVDNTLKTLKNAIFELIKSDKNKLTELYNKYKDLKQGNYTDESYGRFIEALKNVENVIKNGIAAQNDVDDAFKNLQDAVNGLKEKSSGSNSGSSSSSSHRSSSSHKSSSKKDSESEVKSVDSVISEEQDNEIDTATQYKEGWNKKGESWIYIKNGVSVTGWIKDTNGNWYYLNSAGIMQKGWIKDNERWYYLSQSGDMKTGWQYINGAWYYLNEESDGYMGAMKTGWIYTGGRWYLLNQSGEMKKGWAQDKGKWYYLSEDGSMAVNTMVDGYSIGADGSLL